MTYTIQHVILGCLSGALVAVLVCRSLDTSSPGPVRRRLLTGTAQDQFLRHNRQHSGFYVKPGTERLVDMALTDSDGVTDKISSHNYQTLYARHFELGPGRHRVHKMLEIGLGCDMSNVQGIGASARLWRRYFPQTTEVWFAEYDEKCLEVKANVIADLKIKALAGDQGNITTLTRWIQEAGSDFDVIIDDGGHHNHQQWKGLLYLFQYALKPGGLYVIEDLQHSYQGVCEPQDEPCAVVIDVLAQWIQMLLIKDCNAARESRSERMAQIVYPLLPRVKSIECVAEACAITKCFDDDPACDYPGCVSTSSHRH